MSGKTVFAHGTVITPEWCNAIANPVFAEAPQNDGEIPFPQMTLRQLADIEAVTGVEVEGFLQGLGFGQPQGSPAPMTGAQIKAVIEAIDSNPALRVGLVQSLISNLKYPLQKLPLALRILFQGAAINSQTVTSPYQVGNYVLNPIPRILIPSDAGYLTASAFLGNPNLVTPTRSLTGSWGNPQALSAAAVLAPSPFPIFSVSKSVEALMISVYGDTAAAGSRVIRVGIQVTDAADCDYTIPIYFDATDPDLAAAQFSDISIYAFDGNSPGLAARFVPDIGDIWSSTGAKAAWQLRIVRAGDVLKVGASLRPS